MSSICCELCFDETREFNDDIGTMLEKHFFAKLTSRNFKLLVIIRRCGEHHKLLMCGIISTIMGLFIITMKAGDVTCMMITEYKR